MSSINDIARDVVASNITETKGLEKVNALYQKTLTAERSSKERDALERTSKDSLRTTVNTFTNALASRDTSNIPTHLRDRLSEYITEMSNIGRAIDDLLK